MSKQSAKHTETTVSGDYALPLPRQRVWWSLNDPEVLQQCIRGCDRVWRDEDDRFHAEFSFRVGPVKKKLVAFLDVEEVAPPANYDLVASLQSGRVGGAGGRARVTLEPEGNGTRLSYIADVSVDGWLAMMGEPALRLAAAKSMQHFFERFVAVVS